jgi:hypothetical protein
VARSVPYSLSLGFGLAMTLPAFPSCETRKASSASPKLSPPPVSLYYILAPLMDGGPRLVTLVGQRTSSSLFRELLNNSDAIMNL